MESLFYCVECTKFATDPVKLDCTHTFCKACAESLLDLSFLFSFRKDLFQCTICSQKTKLKEIVKGGQTKNDKNPDQQFSTNDMINEIRSRGSSPDKSSVAANEKNKIKTTYEFTIN